MSKKLTFHNRGVAPVVVYDELSRPHSIPPHPRPKGDEKPVGYDVVMNDKAAAFFEENCHEKDKNDVLQVVASEDTDSLLDEKDEENRGERTRGRMGAVSNGGAGAADRPNKRVQP